MRAAAVTGHRRPFARRRRGCFEIVRHRDDGSHAKESFDSLGNRRAVVADPVQAQQPGLVGNLLGAEIIQGESCARDASGRTVGHDRDLIGTLDERLRQRPDGRRQVDDAQLERVVGQIEDPRHDFGRDQARLKHFGKQRHHRHAARRDDEVAGEHVGGEPVKDRHDVAERLRAFEPEQRQTLGRNRIAGRVHTRPLSCAWLTARFAATSVASAPAPRKPRSFAHYRSTCSVLRASFSFVLRSTFACRHRTQHQHQHPEPEPEPRPLPS